MTWYSFYAVAGFAVGTTLFVIAALGWGPDTPAPKYPGLLAVAVGLLWPVLLIAAVQFGLLVAVRRPLGRTAASAVDRARTQLGLQ